jgi:hypothetical protein
MLTKSPGYKKVLIPIIVPKSDNCSSCDHFNSYPWPPTCKQGFFPEYSDDQGYTKAPDCKKLQEVNNAKKR